MYYFCRQNIFQANNIIEIVGHTPVTGALLWTAGHKFSQPVPQQVLDLDPHYGTDLPAFFDTTIPVMSNELIQAFREANVDNFDAYPVTLKRIDTQQEFTDYQAVNFLGSLDCVDLEKSKYKLNKRNKPKRFKSVVLDGTKINDMKVFRLLVGPDLLVVHENIAEALDKLNFKALLFQKTEDFDGF